MIAMVMLLGVPFGVGTMCDSDPQRGLICYCCSSGCTMISCSGCRGPHTVSPADRWSPEMTLESFSPQSSVRVLYCDEESFQSPESITLDVPDKPPRAV